jgi:polyhydroxybutyrate depolymerase
VSFPFSVRRAALFWVAELALSASGCTRADLQAITDEPAMAAEAGAPSVLPPASCPSPALAPGDTTEMLLVGDVSRRFVLHVPSSYDGTKPVALIVDFHGMGESGQIELESSPYPAVTDAEGVIMAFPDGLRGPLGPAWNLGPCCVSNVDDLGFTRALVAHVKNKACIDAQRVYAVGVLTGGGMVQDVACHAADIFAAVSPAAFDLLQEDVDACHPARPISEIAFRGTADPRVPYAGGPSSLVPGMPITFLGARATFDKWGELNGCQGPPSSEDANGCAAYSDCAGGTEVVLCTKQGGGDDPGDARVAWPVLKRHTL